MEQTQDRFCILAHSGLCIESSGRFKPCCNYSTWLDSRDAYNTEPSELSRHPEFKLIRRQLSQGLAHKGCQRCWDDEANGLTSLRQSSNEKYREQYESLEPQIRIGDLGFGNTCNAACTTCESSSSQMWSELDQHLQSHPGNKYQRDPHKPIKRKLNWSISSLGRLMHLYHGQNEVLASPDFLPFLEQLERVSSLGEKTILISTNGSIWPPQKVLDLLKRFKSCHIQISIDALGAENDYIRYPLKWSTVETVTRRWIDFTQAKNMKISMRTTVSIYNILSLGDLRDWWNQCSGHQRMSLGFCWFPHYLSASVFAGTLSEQLKRVSNEFPEVAKLMHNPTDDQALAELFWSFTNTVDEFRGLSFRETFPTLFGLLSKSQKGALCTI
jgi:hypothetical protein